MTAASGPSKRIVVTGMGCRSPLGHDVESTWAAAVQGQSGAVNVTRFDTEGFASTIACELSEPVEDCGLSPKEMRRTDPVVIYSLAAAREALLDSALEIDDSNRARIGVTVGSGIGGLTTIVQNQNALMAKGPRRVSPFTIPMGITNMPSGMISLQHGLQGPNFAHVSACATGTHAIGESAELIARGMADVMIVGGSEAPILPLALAAFDSMRALSRCNDEPTRASRPFDAGRDGFVMGEGAGVLVLETLEHATARGARIRGEILGYGAAADAHHTVAPDAEGGGASRCMQAALDNAGLSPEEVGFVNAHATSTPAGDVAEVVALRRVFGRHCDALPVSATKSMTGHLLGAAGAVEAILSLLALERETLLPTINLDNPDPECALDHVANKARSATTDIALSNSFGFGGTNASLLLGRAGL